MQLHPNTAHDAPDHETRRRLLDAAAQLFAERGFEHVPVRDICKRAGANVAAVNYYFRDKWGLYQELVQHMIQHMRSIQNAAHEAGAGKPPEERLRIYIRTFMQGLLGRPACWEGKLFAREMAEPTAALDLLVEQGIRPNSLRVAALVAELMGLDPSDPRVGRCVGSIQTQCVGYANPVGQRMVGGLRFTPEVIDGIAEHIATFSLGGIRAIEQLKTEIKR